MKIGIIGSSARGCLFAARLFLAADEQDKILLIDHRSTRAGTSWILRESFMSLMLPDKQMNIPVSNTPANAGTLDFLFSCIKSYDLNAMMAS